MPVRELNGKNCKTYLLTSASGKDALLVDPLLERVDDYLALLKAEGLVLKGTLDTHTHADHLSAGAALRDRLDAPYLMHAAAKQSCVTRRLQDGETLGVGASELTVFHTPGHTADSLSLKFDGRFLSGDFLFIGALGAGRLDMPGCDPAAHFTSLRRLDGLEDATVLLPGHDYQGRTDSTLGQERQLNPVLRPRGREEYLQWWAGRKPAPAEWMGKVVGANVACTRDPGAVLIPADQAACACAPMTAHSDDGFAMLECADLAKMLKNKDHGLFLLDVRGPDEFEGELSHIQGSVLIPVQELAARMKEIPAGAKIVSICHSGGRAGRAAKALVANGWTQVWVLDGGMSSWSEAHLPVA